MGEIEEFAEALIDQISVELDEEKEIAGMTSKIADDPDFDVKFEDMETVADGIFVQMRDKIAEFTGIKVPDIKMEFPELADLKKLKGRKVFATPGSQGFVDELFDAISREDKPAIASLIKKDTARFITYSTYAKSYISKISTTYGDYLDGTIYLNRFILSRYPQIILYKQGMPYDARFDTVNSAYRGALKMTILEEMIHSVQTNLHRINKEAVVRVNGLNEELAGIILNMDDAKAKSLTDYLQIQAVPDDFPMARRANLFFMLNPDNFIMNVLGPDVLTFTRVEVDPKISEFVPELLDVYQRWLDPIQTHHAVFSTMEGMAQFCIQGMLSDDADFQEYLQTFMGSSISAYQVRKNMGGDFTKAVFEEMGRDTFEKIIREPPTTRQLKEPGLYIKSG